MLTLTKPTTTTTTRPSVTLIATDNHTELFLRALAEAILDLQAAETPSGHYLVAGSELRELWQQAGVVLGVV
jgi:hypothetical protein